jgi:asparagine synthase (glutamine-hydrolysing)
MCGIFGAISFAEPFDEGSYEKFVALTDLVRYRGPDDSGYVAINSTLNRVGETPSFDVFLGNRRLAILDLSPAGHMPMTDGKGRWITYNGEIFNYIELRRELEQRGHCFSTNTDTEVILRLYDEFGESAFEKLNGMWALAIADLPRRRVVLSRDRFSIKPLYIYRSKEGFYFASEIKQLLPLLASKEVNENVLRAFLIQGLLDYSPETFFRGITRVQPMSNMVLDLTTHQCSETRYAELRPETTNTLDQARERFRDLLFESTRIRLRSDVKVGLLLSGGLDSSSIAVANSQIAEKPLETFSVVFEDSRFSEAEHIALTTRSLGLPSHKVTVKSDDALRNLEAALYHSDEPFGGLSVVAQHRLLRMVKEETDVVVLLSGQGGDEILLGYLKFHFFYLKSLLTARSYGRFARESFLSLLHGTALRNFRLDYARRYIPRLHHGLDWIVTDSYHPQLIWEAADLRARQLGDIEHYSVPALTHYEDRNAMAFSLEIRHPFLDYRLLNFVLGLPLEWQLRNGWTKSILRESLPELPAKIRWSPVKRGFSTPEQEWLRTEMTGLVQSLFTPSILEEMGLVNRTRFLEIFEAYRHGKTRVGHFDLERTIIAEMWARKIFLGIESLQESIYDKATNSRAASRL